MYLLSNGKNGTADDKIEELFGIIESKNKELRILERDLKAVKEHRELLTIELTNADIRLLRSADEMKNTRRTLDQLTESIYQMSVAPPVQVSPAPTL